MIEELSAQMQVIYEKRQSLRNPADLPEPPNNKLHLSDTFILQIDIKSYCEDTFEILTLEEWFDKESILKYSISIK